MKLTGEDWKSVASAIRHHAGGVDPEDMPMWESLADKVKAYSTQHDAASDYDRNLLESQFEDCDLDELRKSAAFLYVIARTLLRIERNL
jgi:hypothetical protein